MIATIHKTGDNDTYSEYPPTEEAKANAEFITYCFNLQQRYNIEHFHEMVACIDSAQKLIDDCILTQSIPPKIASDKIRLLLAKIRKS